ncbi:hypothetical protein BB559_002547 [Furculomyces boomerangus]|uniref:FAS1 domain-containing protein n=2 Tax=Harpellales TaxID=61421 RepID=A0A2T9YUE1_9FUNG|nr:hypothetical protein BB559_002547 [Furculomyces boomerangus]PWA01314.1 hypothetical protein BB558_002595 [Smittium angustum]
MNNEIKNMNNPKPDSISYSYQEPDLSKGSFIDYNVEEGPLTLYDKLSGLNTVATAFDGFRMCPTLIKKLTDSHEKLTVFVPLNKAFRNWGKSPTEDNLVPILSKHLFDKAIIKSKLTDGMELVPINSDTKFVVVLINGKFYLKNKNTNIRYEVLGDGESAANGIFYFVEYLFD